MGAHRERNMYISKEINKEVKKKTKTDREKLSYKRKKSRKGNSDL